MSKSRFGSSTKSREAATRAFAADLEERPVAIAEGARAVVQGNYGQAAIAKAKAIANSGKSVESRLAVLVGTLRYGLTPSEAYAVWGRASLGNQQAAEKALLPVADLIRAASAHGGPPVHQRGKWRTSDAFTGGGYLAKARVGASKSHGSRMRTPPGMTQVKPGVYTKL